MPKSSGSQNSPLRRENPQAAIGALVSPIKSFGHVLQRSHHSVYGTPNAPPDARMPSSLLKPSSTAGVNQVVHGTNFTAVKIENHTADRFAL